MDTIVIFDPAPGPGGAPTAVTLSYVGTDSVAGTANEAAHTISGATLGSSGNGDLLLMIVRRAGPTDITAVTADGNSLTEIAAFENGATQVYCFAGACAGSTGNIVCTNNSSGTTALLAVGIYRIDNYALLGSQGHNANGTLSNNVNTVTDGAVLWAGRHGSLSAMSLVGTTLDGFEDNATDTRAEFGSAATTTNETPRTVGATITGYGDSLAVSFEPA